MARSISTVTNPLPSPAEPAVIAKSSILLDVKPWDDETDMAKLEECVRSIQMDGLVWGQCEYYCKYCIHYYTHHCGVKVLHTRLESVSGWMGWCGYCRVILLVALQ